MTPSQLPSVYDSSSTPSSSLLSLKKLRLSLVRPRSPSSCSFDRPAPTDLSFLCLVYYSITICLHSKRFPRSACAVDSLLTSHPSTLSCLRRRESISYIHNPFSIYLGRWINKVNPEFPAPLAASFI
ncbi:hypothetical protein BDV34DRAFT_154693 [Aspergillus parasiticus]|uniref:Uncharacterized protein n=1 Tax=Aspergillus parasiticus TaxID=5067 RepID=A0A5N6DZH2_ASPPA|nr:hypothetical protein BDV34DRAFT_154693 [Aspergillus parasiticus]